MAFGPDFREDLAELRRRGLHGPEAARAIVERRFFALPETAEELDDLTVLTTEPGAFPEKLGLVGGLYAEVCMGWQTVSAAVRQLEDGATEQDAPARYCARLAGISIVIAQLGRVHDGLVLARLVLAAAVACYGEESTEWVDAAAAYLQCSMLLESVERDPALQGADDIADRILARARTVGDEPLLARVLSLTAQRLRYARADDTSEQETANLQEAAARLTQAADLRSGPERGRTLGTLAQVLNDLHTRGIGDERAIASTVCEAIHLIDRTDRPLQWLVTRGLARQFGAEPSELTALTPDKLLEIQARQGTVTAQRCLDYQVRLLRDDDRPIEAWTLLDTVWTPLEVPSCGQEELRRRLLSSAAHLADAGACPCRELNRHSARPIEKRLKQLPPEEELPARLHLAMHKDFFLASKDWALFEAPHLIDTVEKPALIEALVFAVADVHARQIGQDQRDALLAIRCGLLAATRLIELRLRDLAIETLGVVLGVMARWRDRVLALSTPDAARRNELEAILDGVLHSAGYFDMSLADLGREWLLVAGRALCAPARASVIASPALALAHSVAFKGALTAELIAKPGLGVGEQVSDGQALVEIAALDRLERTADAASDTTADDSQIAPEWQEELRRAAWLHVAEQRSGSSVRQRRLNQQARYDDWLQRQLATARTPLGLDYRSLSVAGAGNALGAGTVLIDLYLGDDASGAYATFVTVIAPSGHLQYLVPHARPSSLSVGDASDPDSRLLLDGIAELVASVRYRVREPCAHREISREGSAALAAAAHDVFGRLHEDLERLRGEGCRHLVICPHGPLALLPFPLLPVEGRPLSDDWLVTVVPTVGTALGSWNPTNGGLGSRSQPGSLGVIASPGGGVPFGLPEEPRLWDQVTELEQRRHPVSVLPRGSATPTHAIALMGQSRFVHVAAHGSAIAEVPAFHCLYLDSEGDDDGRLFAHDLLRSDLRRVELVTLCACESALGRVDPAGNLRGLPTALLAAGVGAVVATLWPVAAEPALRFFADLHSELDAGADRLTAFRSAQVASRRNFPRFAHWSAFTYIGYWR